METTVTVVNFCSVSTCQISNSFHFCSRMDKEPPAAESMVLEEDQEHYGEGDVTDAKPDRKGRFILFGR